MNRPLCYQEYSDSRVICILKWVSHDDVIKWKHFPRYWPFVRGFTGPRWIPRTKASDAELWCFLICVWINAWVNNREAGDLRQYHVHYDVTVMIYCHDSLFIMKCSPCPHQFQCGMCDPKSTWWRHQMETFSALLAICAGNSPVHGEFPAQRPVTRSFDVFFDVRPNKHLRKQSWGWWFETLSPSLWRHRNEHTAA